MTPADICREVLGQKKLESILEELSSTQVKAILKEGNVRAKVPGAYVSRNKRRSVWAERVQGAIAEGNDELASEFLQQWLLNHRRQVLVDFLDRLEVKHMHGETDESFITASPRDRVLEEASWLLKQHDRSEVVAYLLYVAHQQHSKVFEEWPELRLPASLPGETSQPSPG